VVAVLAGVLAIGPPAALSSDGASTFGERSVSTRTSQRASAARILLVGDVMLGRNVAHSVQRDPDRVFAGVRAVLEAADLAGGNLESPLTDRPHLSPNPYALEASPSSARVLAEAGFDLLTIANNHSGDAGRASVVDTWSALAREGLLWAGGGPDADAAWDPLVVHVAGVAVAFLAVDGSRSGLPAGARAAGIAHWDADRVGSAVGHARTVADVVIVSIHGGEEYRTEPDPWFASQVETLVDAGADVVWGHGPHVRQPVVVRGGTVAASSLGNFLFDQPYPGTTEGALLEVLADEDGVVAFRVGDSTHGGRRVVFGAWRPPEGDAVLLDGAWWTLVRPLPVTTPRDLPPMLGRGDPVVRSADPDARWRACDAGAVLLDVGLRRGWSWDGAATATMVEVPVGEVGCADVDRDGRTEPQLSPTPGFPP
jgi:poly-gamma-glutamate synthesis protein (capsule biosynthesis protein)